MLFSCTAETTPATMDQAIAVLMAKPEQPDGAITVQHVLIAFKGAERATATRSKDEAKVLAEKLWAEAIGGADFKTLMKQSNDPGPGEYTMTKGAPDASHPGAFPRDQMVPAFGDVGWRLKVGEIGVGPYDPQKSKFGWHIIKRVK